MTVPRTFSPWAPLAFALLLLLPPPVSGHVPARSPAAITELSERALTDWELGRHASDMGPRSAASPYVTLERENMPWLCNGCGLSLNQGLTELGRMAENESGVSYIQYFVTSTGSIYCQCPDQTSATGHALGLDVIPMINSADNAGSDALSLIDHRNWWPAFIQAAMATANSSGYEGYNWDIEGTGSGTPPANTSAEYAHLLWQFANASHAQGIRTTVDVAWFDPQLWNATYLSATSVDVFYDMDYYSWYYFWNRLYKDLGQYPRDRLGEGLSGDVGNGVPCPGDVGLGGFSQRVHILESYNITHTAFWAMADWAVGNGCWDYPSGVGALLHDFLFNGSRSANWTLDMGGAPDGWAFCPGGWSYAGTPPVGACAPSSLDGMNVTLFTANATGAVGPVTLEGNASITRLWNAPLTRLDVGVNAYLDERNVTLAQQNLSCGTKYVLSSGLLPTGIGWSHRSLNETFAPGSTCGVRFILSAATPGPVTGENDWFANLALSFPPPSLVARATGSPLTGATPLAVAFSGSATGGVPPYGWVWAFGDGTGALASTANHTYGTVGNYTATLKVTDATGVSSTASLGVEATAGSPPRLTLAATATPQTGSAPLLVSFAAAASGGTAPYTYAWDFGDTSSGTGFDIAHTYTSPGSYTVVVTVTDGSGRSTQTTIAIIVTVPTSPPPLPVQLGATPSTVVLGDSVRLSVEVSGGLSPFTYAWQGLPSGCSAIGGGNLSCAPDQVGRYQPSVVVTDSSYPSRQGNASTSFMVTLGPAPAPTSTGPRTPSTLELAAVLGAAGLGVLLLGAVVWRRKRSGGAPRSDPRDGSEGP
ncbi:MAG: PKD domain-containing protein [Euryarchaeota archaeon]|nr:PKD domain-containing protein [Euryarchaeota archaeon]MDE1835543.1 PKD domain-containing protein [Euryarchaeota archaeon]MDE1879634.1 PKD domain-containing protein [Euryarchaeota archaeon]MDE2043835.1 PKD domain-containing protein [Thermoplasmata archaeon]